MFHVRWQWPQAETLARAAGLVVVAVGVLVLVGWLGDISFLKGPLPGLVQMKADTAVGFVALGGALVLSTGEPTSRRRRVAAGLALGAVGIGVLTITEYVFGVNLGLDQLLIRDTSTVHTVHPGRLAPQTAFNFVVLGVALAIPTPLRRWRWLPGVLAGVAFLIALFAALGYVYGAPTLSGVPSLTPIALHTAVTFLVLCVGILATNPDSGFVGLLWGRGSGSVMTRRLLPLPLVVFPLLGWLRLEGQRQRLYPGPTGAALLVLASMAALGFTTLLLGRRLNRIDAERSVAADLLSAQTDDLQRVNAELAATNGELNAFAYSVSHDLRAPLRAIDGFSRIVLEDAEGSLSDDQQRYLGLVRENTQTMGVLIDDLLAFSRLANQPLARRTVQTEPLVAELERELTVEDDGRTIEFVNGELPAVQADPALLRQVFANLIGNAVKYTGQCEPSRISVGCEHRDGELAFMVADNGVGFDMRYAEKLFQVFQRLHRAEDYEGTGVGLAIVQRIVTRHGGRVWAQSTPGEGATFYFTLDGGTP